MARSCPSKWLKHWLLGPLYSAASKTNSTCPLPQPRPSKKGAKPCHHKNGCCNKARPHLPSCLFHIQRISRWKFFCPHQYCCVVEEGPQEDFFDQTDANNTVPTSPGATPQTEQETDIDPAVFASGNRAENNDFVHNQGLEVDDDKDTAPENVPQPNEVQENHNFKVGQAWG